MNRDILNQVIEKPLVARSLCLASLKTFISVFHYYLYNRPFIFKPFHITIIKALESIVFKTNTKRNLLINVPYRSGKSQILKYFTAWSYAINYHSNFIVTSYGHSLIIKYSQEVRDLINSELYKAMFGLSFDDSSTAKELWKIKDGGELRATSMGGTITGFGAGVIGQEFGGALIIDDPLKADDYKSTVSKENCIDFYVNTLKSRKNNPTTPVILIMQRLAKDDLSGYILKNEFEDWEYIKLPALDENDNSFWEEKFPADELKKIREVHPYLFHSQLQQEPIILGGSVIKSEWFGYYPLEANYKYKKIVISADTAISIKESADYTAFIVGGVTEQNKLHILDIVRARWEYPELRTNLVNLYNKWQFDIYTTSASSIYIENKASGQQLIQELKKATGLPIIPIDVTKDKLTRVEEILDYIASGNVLMPVDENYGNNHLLLNECMEFNREQTQTHDDVLDATVHLINNTIAKRKVSILDVL